MNHPKLAWYQLSRDEIPTVAYGAPIPKKRTQETTPTLSYSPDMACSVGFPWEQSGDLEYIAPAAFVLNDQNLSETLSWLRVYAREAFPLSQFSRVISVSDWKMISGDFSVGRSFRDDRWASIVLGELLAQSEQDAGLESVPLSRALACFSTPVARTQKIYDSYETTNACTNRLRAIEGDPRFVRRSITVDSLVPIWALASTTFGNVSDVKELADFIVSAAESIDDKDAVLKGQLRPHLPQNLYSDSIEERVVAFQHLATELSNFTSRSAQLSSYAAAMIAAGAFLVGRSTSHSFLIKKFSRTTPLAYAWFGLMAGILGSKFWDQTWSKPVKGVEKHIRLSFSWNDPPISDISWAEYNWIANIVRGHQAFAGISRQVQTSLSIEILPGVSCQMRLQGEELRQPQSRNDTSIQTTQPREDASSNPLAPEVISALEQIIKLSVQSKDLLSSTIRKNSNIKTSNADDLFSETDKGRARKSPGVKRSPRNRN